MIQAMDLSGPWNELLLEVADAVREDAVAVLQLVIAAACGAVVGWNREMYEKAAGLRTHMLLALGACLFTIVGLRLGGDNTRLLQGMVTGVGFLAAGVIFREGPSVHGLTTAAGLWVMAAVGLTIGMSEYFLGILATLLTLLVMSVLRQVEQRIVRHLHGSGPGPGGAGAG